jgi:DNA recombination protein RmuC
MVITIAEVIILAVLSAVIISLFIKLNSLAKVNSGSDDLVKEIRDKLISMEAVISARLDAAPDIINSRNADTLQVKFTDLIRIVSENNGEMIKKFGELQNELTRSLSENTSKNTALIQEKFDIFMDKTSKSNTALLDRFSALQTELTRSLGESSKKVSDDFLQFKNLLDKGLSTEFDKLLRLVEDKLDKINRHVQENLNEGFKKTNETFSNVLERLARIDEAQKNIDKLSVNVISLQNILTDKKSRGIFGEVQLNQVLHSVFGEKNDKVFSIQHKLPNGNIVDAMLFTPEPTGNIPVDSKFPLENYQRMTDKSLTDKELDDATKGFKIDIRNHIDAISSKYIIPGTTCDHAIMFLPAESIFAEINAYHPDLVDYAFRHKVWIVSPTTFMAVLGTLQIVLYNVERKKFADIIQQEIVKLGKEFERYSDRWNRLSTDIDKVQKDVKDIYTTSQKITTAFEKISRVELDEPQPHIQIELEKNE